jgi:hypothetical protein
LNIFIELFGSIGFFGIFEFIMAKCSVGLYGVWLVESKGFIDRDR